MHKGVNNGLEAKAYLKQVQKLDRMIENKLAEIEQWREMATCTTQRLSADKVQSSPNPQKMADAICKIVQIEGETDVLVDRLVDTKREVIKTLERLVSTEYDVLHKVYIQYMTFEEVAERKGKSYSWVKKVHQYGMQNLQKILNEKEKQAG